MVLHRTKVKEFHPWPQGNHICSPSSLPLIHVALDCRAEAGSQ